MASGSAQKKRSFGERFMDGAKMIIFGDSPIKDSPKALFTTPGTYQPVYPSNFNGEKNLGELVNDKRKKKPHDSGNSDNKQ